MDEPSFKKKHFNDQVWLTRAFLSFFLSLTLFAGTFLPIFKIVYLFTPALLTHWLLVPATDSNRPLQYLLQFVVDQMPTSVDTI